MYLLFFHLITARKMEAQSLFASRLKIAQARAFVSTDQDCPRQPLPTFLRQPSYLSGYDFAYLLLILLP